MPGEKNDTHTMLDAAVYDIRSRKMLFRAPGTSHIKAHATLANLSEQRRSDSAVGFKKAATQMIANLDQQWHSSANGHANDHRRYRSSGRSTTIRTRRKIEESPPKRPDTLSGPLL